VLTVDTYKIIRYFRSGKDPIVIKTGLTFTEARKHCIDPQTMSKTATDPAAIAFTKEYGAWIDRWVREEK
jgi:hypothetical protein